MLDGRRRDRPLETEPPGPPGRISAFLTSHSNCAVMRLLQYKDLDLRRVKPAFAKVRGAIEARDFKSPDVKKLHIGGYWRAGR